MLPSTPPPIPAPLYEISSQMMIMRAVLKGLLINYWEGELQNGNPENHGLPLQKKGDETIFSNVGGGHKRFRGSYITGPLMC